jgi:nucleoside-diphosphate-sugar epimerase
VWVKPETRVAIMYFKDAARAIVLLGEAPVERIKMVNYVIAGPSPDPSAQELVDKVRAKIPGAALEFKPDPDRQRIIEGLALPLDDATARAEWGWAPRFDLERMVEDFLRELKGHPQRYA